MSQVHIPGGFGSRHSSTAGITGVSKSIGIVVSQSGGMITLFRDGKILHTISS
jgi:DNA integrity scanning protein DisA with diadenylate cyclase activity